MKYSLRSLLVLIILVAIGLSVKSRRDYLEWRSFIPVTYEQDPYYETQPPPRIHVKFGQTAVSGLVSRKAAAPEKETFDLTDILDSPNWFSYYQADALKEAFPDWQKLSSDLVVLLEDQSHDLKDRVRFARIAITLGNREAVDWILRVSQKNETDGFELNAFYHAPQELIDEINLWSLIEPKLNRENSYRNHDLFNVADKHCREQAYQYLEQALVDGRIRADRAASVAYALCVKRPTLRALKASSFLFPEARTPDFDWHAADDHAKVLEHYLEVDDAAIHKLALNYAKRMANDDHSGSRAYMEVMIDHVDSSWEPFFREQCKKGGGLWQSYALEGLIQTWSESTRTAKLWNLIEEESEFADARMKEIALAKMIERLVGAKDAKLTIYLHAQFQDAKENWQKRNAVDGLYQLGHRPIELLKEVEPDLADGRSLNKLIALLHQYEFAKEITVKQINEQVMQYQEYRHFDYVQNKDQVKAALELAGLRNYVRCIEEVDVQLANFSKLSQGKIEFENVHLNHSTSQVEFEFRDRVFQIDLESTDDYFDVYYMSEILNAILARDGIEERFLLHASGRDEPCFFFGPPRLAKSLRDDFGISFQEPTSMFLDSLIESER